MPRRTIRSPKLGGIGDFFEDAGKFVVDHGDQIADIAEIVVPIVAPAAAPVVAAEHALRKGIELSQAQAKAATTGATAVGKAVAEHVAATQVAGSSEETPVRTTRATQELADPDAKGSGSSSGNGLLIAGAIVLGIILFGME